MIQVRVVLRSRQVDPAALTGLRATISHHTMACPAMVMAVKSNPLIANNGTKYVKIDAEGILAVFLGT